MAKYLSFNPKMNKFRCLARYANYATFILPKSQMYPYASDPVGVSMKSMLKSSFGMEFSLFSFSDPASAKSQCTPRPYIFPKISPHISRIRVLLYFLFMIFKSQCTPCRTRPTSSRGHWYTVVQ